MWLFVYAFLFSYFDPRLILTETLTTGGDTASHYYTLVYFRELLLNEARIMGWLPGHYAGFPLFQLYFPLPFLLMVVLGLALPLTMAFKVISIAGVLTLPLGAYLGLKRMGFEEPAPDLGAAFVLPFLFMEANSMWGGNIPSTLAGEFAYGLGLTLTLVYLGNLYRGIQTGRGVVQNAVLLALVGLSHGYTLLFCVLGAGFFLITTKDWIFRLAYLLKVNLLAFCFLGFWIVPLILFSPYTVPYNFVWVIDNWSKVLPSILWPFIGLGLGGAAFSFLYKHEHREQRNRILFLLYLILIAAIFYFIAYKIGVVDIRFIPFGQVFFVLLGAVGAGRFLTPIRPKSLAALTLALGTVLWTSGHEHYIGQWIKWNYTGYETKRLWPAFKKVNEHLRGSFADPRVAYEHAEETQAVGTIRAF